MQDNFDLKNLLSTKKKRKNSRTKGNSFERKVCAILNEFFETDEFIRSPGSGAFSTTHNLPEYLKFSGDLITPKDFALTIECKKGYNKENLGSIFNPKSELISFIEQSERDSQKIKKEFLLLFQQDRNAILAIYRKSALFPNLDGKEIIYAEFKFKNREYMITRLDDILKVMKDCGLRWLWKKA
tara:strand:+ start:12007 stop:12558 length:552 start_codon:yes stop_codon:yes gene_type:complete